MKTTMVWRSFIISIVLGHTLAYAAPTTVEYKYDDLNRVTEEQRDGKITTYTYDEVGNILTQTIVKKIVSIAVSPTAPPAVNARQTTKFTATATYQDGTTAVITPVWTRTPTSVASISSSGLATALAAGTTNITAAFQGVTSPASVLTVSATPIPVNFNSYPVTAYGIQDASPVVTVENNGTTLRIKGNGWKKISFGYAPTSKTIMEFDFQSAFPGDIHGIGLEEDNTETATRVFQLFGSEVYGLQTYKNYSSGVKHYKIPAGVLTTSGKVNMVFVNDHDAAPPTAESIFSNIKVFEDTTTPTTPVGVTLTPVSATQINLGWSTSTDNVEVAGYRVYRNGVQVGTTTAAVTTFSDQGLTSQTTYTYTVKSIDTVGNLSASSQSKTAKTL